MSETNEQVVDMLHIYQHIYEDEVKREQSIHRSASSLVIASCCLLGFISIPIVMYSLVYISLVEKILIIAIVGTLFASILIAILAQWQKGRQQIASCEAIRIQLEENSEAFQTPQQIQQYEYDMYQEICTDIQNSNRVINHRLRAAGITMVTGAGLFIVFLCFMMFQF